MKNTSLSSQYGLVLHTENSRYVPADTGHLTAQLQSAGFLGDFFTAARHSGFLTGNEFLKQVIFLGCSPKIELTLPEKADDWSHFCHIEIRQHSEPVFFKGLSRLKCTCPGCNARFNEIPFDSEQWQAEQPSQACSKCHQSSVLEHLNWKHTAGFGRLFIIVHSVFPHEAVPSDKLMDLLQVSTAQTWNYFYFER